jgi:hypothetical protein
MAHILDGTYTGEGNRDIDFNGKAITVSSENGPENCIIDCNGTRAEPHRGFRFHSGEDETSILDGFTITNGYENRGGGICCETSNPTINNCLITDNDGSGANPGGAGIYCYLSNPRISNCTISKNSVSGSGDGGGMFNFRSNPTFVNCMFLANSAGDQGGGMWNWYSNPMMRNCTFRSNSANGGGAIRNWDDSHPVLENCTFNCNSAPWVGGIRSWRDCSVKLQNCLLWGNTAVYYGDEAAQIRGGTLDIDYCFIEGWRGTLGGSGNSGEDPLITLDGHLSKDSPCIDAGDPNYKAGPEEIDIDGEPRFTNGRVDIGADEFNFTPVVGLSHLQFEFSSIEGSPNPEEQILSVTNVGTGTINWEIAEACSWLEVNPDFGSSFGETDEVGISVNISVLAPGLHTCEFKITADEAVNSSQIVKVSLYIYDPDILYVPSEYSTIQSAIDWACDGAVIIVSDGTYTGEGNQDIDFKGKEITVQSKNGPENCIIDCQKSGGGFFFHSGETPNSVIEGFSITNTYYSAISCRESSPTIANCNISNSWGDRGGGIDCRDNSCPIISNCTITGCMSGFGGGIACRYGSNAKINNCAIIGNLGGDAAGGIWCARSTVTLTNCIVIGNIGAQNGGGISCSEATLTAANCTFADNSAPVGNFLGCVFWGDYRSYVTLSNCIIRNGGDEIFNSNNSVITINYSNIQGSWPGTGNIDADPCFVSPGYWGDEDAPNIIVEPNDPYAMWFDGDYHLLADSSCIDAGDPNYIAEPNETDLDGNPRVKWGRIDMGAYEYSPPISARILPRTINLASKGKWITCYIWLLEDYDVADIDPNGIVLEDEIEAESFRVDEQQQIAIVRFSRSEVQGILTTGEVELTITGQLTDGTVFEATDIIKVIDKGGKK